MLKPKRPRDPNQLGKMIVDMASLPSHYTPVELASGVAAFDIVFAWIKRAGTRAGYSCSATMNSPVGPFREILGPDHFIAYHYPPKTSGSNGRLDFCGKTDLNRLILLANVVTARGANVRRL